MSPLVTSLCVFVLLHVSPAQATDDANPLQALYEQQAQKMEQMEAKLTALENTVSAMGRTVITLGRDVAFTAHFSASSVNVGSGAPLVFDTMVTNIGDGYNSHTGAFTAPVSGVYYFTLHITHDADDSHSYIHVIIDKDGQQLCRTAANSVADAGSWDQSSCHVVTHLVQGQQVFARQVEGHVFLQGGAYTALSGFLVSPDTD